MAVLKFYNKPQINGVANVKVQLEPRNPNNIQIRYTGFNGQLGSLSVPKNCRLRIEIRDADLQSIKSDRCLKIIGNAKYIKSRSIFVDGVIKELYHNPNKEVVYTKVDVMWGPKAHGPRSFDDLTCKVLRLNGKMMNLEINLQGSGVDVETVILDNVLDASVDEDVYIKGDVGKAVVNHITATSKDVLVSN